MFNNEDRANTAKNAVDLFAAETGITEEENDTQIKDLLCNLRHLCDKSELDFDELADSSYRTYLDEVQSEKEK